MRVFFCFVFLLLFVSACQVKTADKATIEGTWNLNDIVPEDEENMDFSTLARLKKEVTDGLMLSFFSDHSFSEIHGSGKMNIGKWEKKKSNRIEITGLRADPEVGKIKTEKNNKGISYEVLELMREGIVFKFIKGAPAVKNEKDDPFHPANNQWRVKSAGKESVEQLKEKMAGYFKHLALLLKASKERQQDVVSFEFSKGPVKIYSGAIGIYPYEMVPGEWKNTFYNDSSALAAYQLFEKHLTTSSYKGSGTGDWVEDDYKILISIYNGFTE